MSEHTWNELLRDQIDWHWTQQLRDRLAGLTDDEYFWEPVPDCWNVRPRGTGTAPVQAGSGEMTIDFAFPPPEPPPFTTISWRLGHVIVGVLAMRNASHFGGSPVDLRLLRVRDHGTGRPGPAGPRVCDLAQRRGVTRRGRVVRPVRRGRGALRRGPARAAGAPHQPRADPPSLGGVPAARPVRAHPDLTTGRRQSSSGWITARRNSAVRACDGSLKMTSGGPCSRISP